MSCGERFDAKWLKQYVCSACVERDKARILERERRRRLEWLGLSGRLVEMTLERFQEPQQPEAAAAVRRFLDAWPTTESLALLGGPGVGKTHLACAILLELERHDVIGRYVHLPRLVARIRLAADQREAERSLLAPLWRVPLLVLDDVGRETDTPHWRQGIDALIDARWVERLPTVVTGNLTQHGLAVWLGPASASRYMSTAEIVELRGPDRRMVPGGGA